MKLIIGLGNPGIEYKQTKHNIGFVFVDMIANHYQLEFTKSKFNGLIAKSPHFILAKPHTYMNLSGHFVYQLMQFFKIALADVLIIYDEIDLPLGTCHLKAQGSANGQKGMQSIIDLLKTNSIKRIRVGIGRPLNPSISIPDYVLSNFNNQEKQVMLAKETVFLKSIAYFLKNDFQKAMQVLNTKTVKEL